MERQAWFCPSCQKHHAPHVETCPGPVEVRPLPGGTVPAVYPVMPRHWEPRPGGTPWVPYYPVVTGVGIAADPNVLIMSGVATTRAEQ